MSDLTFVLELAVGIAFIGAFVFVVSEAAAEHQRQRIARQRRKALSDQRAVIQQWVSQKRAGL